MSPPRRTGLARRIVRRPIAVIMVMSASVLLGVIASNRLPIQLLPPARQVRLQVTVLYPGASASEVDRHVAQPLERALRAMRSAERVTTLSRADFALIDVRFASRTPPDGALLETREAVDMIRPTFPPMAGRPTIAVQGAAAGPVMTIAVGSPDSTQVSHVVAATIRRRLEQVPGVATVDLDGAAEPEISIALNDQLMAAHSITPALVAAAVSDAAVSAAAGTIRHGHQRIPIRTATELGSADEVGALPLLRNTTGAPLRIRDLADVAERERPRAGAIRLDGQPAVVLTVQADADASAIAVAARVDSALMVLRTEFTGIRIVVAQSRVTDLTLAVRSLAGNAIAGGLLAVVLLFLLLPDWRHAIIVASAVPVSLGIALLLFRATGTSLNLMSLGGLALGVGMLTDAAIVTVSSIAQRLSNGGAPIDSAVDGLSDTAAPLIGSALTTAAVFAPAAFVADATGALLADVAVAVACALGASTAVALLLVPVLCAYASRNDAGMPHPTWRAYIERAFDRWAETHHRMVAAGRARPTMAIVLIAGGPLLVGSLVLDLPRSLLPGADRGLLLVTLRFPSAMPFAEVAERSLGIERRLSADMDVAGVVARAGLTESGRERRPNESVLLVRLANDARDSTVLRRFQQKLSRETGMTAQVQQGDGTSLASLLGAEPHDVILELEGEGADAFAGRLASAMRSNPAFSNVSDPDSEHLPERRLVIDSRKAAMFRVPQDRVVAAIALATRGTHLGTVRRGEQEIPIVMRIPDSTHGSDRLLNRVRVGAVPLGVLVSEQRGQAPGELRRSNGELVSRVSADVAPGSSTKAREFLNRARATPPPAVSLRVHGADADLRASLLALAAALGMSLLVVYVILAAEFESLVQPLIVMLTIPVGISGAVVALWLTGAGLNAMSLIGIVMLAGIVDNDAVVKLDAIHRARAEGASVDEAIIAAARSRLRPIIINSLTAIGGALPVAVGIGTGAALQAPLAIALIGGLLTSTVLAPVAVSVMYGAIESGNETRRTPARHRPSPPGPRDRRRRRVARAQPA